MTLLVLIADDEPIERKVLQKIITDSKLPATVVSTARSGNEAIEQFNRYMPDLIFMDIRMPGMNGLDVSAAIKHKQPDTCIAMVTAYDEFQYAKRAIDIHVDYFLLKPVDPLEVERVIRDTLIRMLGPDPKTAVGNSIAISPNRAQLADKIITLLHNHYAQAITLAWLESRLNVSQQYLSRTFKEAYNISIMTYLTQFRIKLSLQLLADPELSIAAVADQVGIPDASYFGQIFKNMRGVTPTEYRNNLFSSRHGTDLAEPGSSTGW